MNTTQNSKNPHRKRTQCSLHFLRTMGRSRRKPQIVEKVSESDDEEISEDGAFDSDDERQYGAFFASREHDDDDDDDTSDDEEDDDNESGDGGQYMLDLLDKIDTKPPAKKQAAASHGISHVKESPHAVVAGTTANAVSLDSLLQGIQDTQEFGLVQKTAKQISTQLQPTATPVDRVVSDRANRKVHYEIQQQEISQWTAAVQANRKAETLDFRPKERLQVTRDVMLAKFVPSTDLEREIHAALEEEAANDEEALRQAEDDLGANNMTIEQYRERRNQLAKMRALMFYHEQKRHKINKIKSKQYRRIRKRQRDRQKEMEVEDNPQLLRDLQEKEEVERMKERATLAHKNTSKWAKRILKRGKNVDVDTRKALSAQLKRGDDLRKRIQPDTESDDDDDDENLVDAARKTLEDAEDEDPTTLRKGLFKMSFMQKGAEKQRERAKEEARRLLLELEATNEEIEDSDEEPKSKQKAKKPKAPASKKEMNELLKDGDLMVSSIKFNNGTSVATDGKIQVEDFIDKTPARVEELSTTFEQNSKPEFSNSVTGSPSQNRKTNVDRTASSVVQVQSQQEGETNPWLPTEATKPGKSSNRKRKSRNSRLR